MTLLFIKFPKRLAMGHSEIVKQKKRTSVGIMMNNNNKER